MLRLGVLIWILVAIVLAGVLVTVVLLIPQLNNAAMQNIPIAAVVGAVVAIPLSWGIAKAIVSRA